jgi:hypothetical protein
MGSNATHGLFKPLFVNIDEHRFVAIQGEQRTPSLPYETCSDTGNQTSTQ